jgi:hypothetical protein
MVKRTARRLSRTCDVFVLIAAAVFTLLAIPQSSAQADTQNPKVTILREMLESYASNEISADGLYGSQRIKTWGVVKDLGVMRTDSLYVTIQDASGAPRTMLQAIFDQSSRDELSRLTKGQVITVECTIDRMLINLMTSRCKLLKVS